MAIVSSTIKVYADANKETLVTSVTTSGSSTTIPLDNLDPGTVYWATVTATDSRGVTSAESQVYQFYTLPYIEFTGTMHTGSDWFSSALQFTTTDVGISKWGIAWDTSSSFDNPTYKDVHPMPSQEVTIDGLTDGTTYYARATVIDAFGRRWTNPNTVTVTTASSLPVIEWTGLSALGPTSFSHGVNIQSTTALSSVVAVYTPYGGSPVTVNLTAATGTQSVSLTGLTPNTNYSLVVRATNTAGTAESTVQTFTTDSSDVTIECAVGAVDNATNIISADSKVHYDSSVVTLTGHYIDLYSNPDHEGTPDEEVSGGAVTPISLNLGHADPDETYFVFSHATYTIGEDPTEYEIWSEPVEVLTYSLFKFTKVKPTDTTAEIRYAVAGNYGGTEIQYSTDGVNWLPVSSGGGDIREGVIITDLTPDTTYYLRGRCKSAAGWSGWDETTFTTASSPAHPSTTQVNVISVTNITTEAATINLEIS